MNITAAFVVFLMLWFLCLFVALPIGIRTQGEAGSVVPGTPSSAPDISRLGRKLVWVTVVAAVLWGVVFCVVSFSGLSMRDLDVWNRM